MHRSLAAVASSGLRMKLFVLVAFFAMLLVVFFAVLLVVFFSMLLVALLRALQLIVGAMATRS